MGRFPTTDRVPLDVKYEEQEHIGSYIRLKLSYAASVHDRVPAYLLRPVGAHRRAAILCLHQTNEELGKAEPVGLAGDPNLAYADELAKRGYVVLAPDYVGFGEHKFDLYQHGWESGCLKAVWDNMRAVDFLLSLAEVEAGRIACLGHSLGGHTALFTSAFDQRIRATVSNCGFTSFEKYRKGDLTTWALPQYMPRIRTDGLTTTSMPFDFTDVFAAIAPRSVLAIAPLHDDNFDVSGVKDVVEETKKIYQSHGSADHLEARYPDHAHEWPESERALAYRWLDRQFSAQ